MYLIECENVLVMNRVMLVAVDSVDALQSNKQI
jgi:hypothetical protein